MSIVAWFKNRTYRCKTQMLISGVSGFCVLASLVVFSISDHRRIASDTQRDVRATADLLSNLMRNPPNKTLLAFLANETVVALKLTKIEVRDSKGYLIIEAPEGVPAVGYSARSSVHLNSMLFTENPVSMPGPPSAETSEILVYSDGNNKHADSMNTLMGMGVIGGVFWVTVSLFGYIMTRKTTLALDRLSAEICRIESGETNIINLDGIDGGMLDGLKKLAIMINDMSASLCLRGCENASIQKKIADQMRGRAEKAEQVLQSKLLQANKMSTLGLLVSGVVHEINNPNTMIRLETESLERIIRDVIPIIRAYAAEEGLYYLGGMSSDLAIKNLVVHIITLKQQSIRIDEVVKGMRDHVTGDRSTNKKEVDIGLIVSRCKYLLQTQIKTVECTLEEHLEDGLTIFANQYDIESVIINLLQNAFRAAKSRGLDGIVSICSHRSGNNINISVTDNGSGIDPEDIPHLCNPFFSKHLDEGGTGLGLFISKGILDDHNGSIEFTPGVWTGTTVLLRFPVGGSE